MRHGTRQLAQKIREPEKSSNKYFTYGDVLSVTIGSGVVSSYLTVDIAGTTIPNIQYAKNSGIAVDDRVLLLDLGGIWFAVCAVQP